MLAIANVHAHRTRNEAATLRQAWKKQLAMKRNTDVVHKVNDDIITNVGGDVLQSMG